MWLLRELNFGYSLSFLVFHVHLKLSLKSLYYILTCTYYIHIFMWDYVLAALYTAWFLSALFPWSMFFFKLEPCSKFFFRLGPWFSVLSLWCWWCQRHWNLSHIHICRTQWHLSHIHHYSKLFYYTLFRLTVVRSSVTWLTLDYITCTHTVMTHQFGSWMWTWMILPLNEEGRARVQAPCA